MHQAVALRRKRVLIGLKGPIVPPAQPLCILPAQPQGALALIGPLLLLHLQHGEIRPGAVSPQADLPPQLQSVDLILEVLVVRGVKIQGANPVSLGAIVGIGVHDIPASRLVLELGYSIDYEDEKEDFEPDENDTVELISGGRMPWEQVKRDGIDYIALYYVDEGGKQVQILDAELA